MTIAATDASIDCMAWNFTKRLSVSMAKNTAPLSRPKK